MAALLAHVSGGDSDAGNRLTYPNPTPVLEPAIISQSLSRTRQQNVFDIREQMRAMSEIVGWNEVDSSQSFNGERPPHTDYEQGLAVLQRVYLGITVFTRVDVVALVRLSLAIGTELDGHLQTIPCEEHYKDILHWSYVISPGIERQQYLTTAAAFWCPTSNEAVHSGQMLPTADGQSSLIAQLKKGFVIQVCLRHLNGKLFPPSDR